MSKLGFSLSVLLANCSAFVVKMINGTEGTSLPGLVALKCSGDFFQVAQRYCRKAIINITGTNGKTTSAGVFAHILQTNNNTVIHNEQGANMLSGIASSIARGVKFFNKHDYFVLECDEAYLTKLYDFLSADYLLVTNLFRDQLDRYGELDNIYNKIQEAIRKNPRLKLILNADDPLTSNLCNDNKKIFYGIEDIIYHDSVDFSSSPAEKVNCSCGQDYIYDKLFYAHIGHYRCTCGKQRVTPDYSAKVKIYSYKTEMIISHNGIQYGFTTYLPGMFNAYNVLSAIVLALEMKVDKEVIQKALNTYEPIFGRTEKIKIKGKNALVQLIKNPVGATEVLRTLQNTPNTKLLIIINDNYADGRDVSWLWDTDFSLIENNGKNIIVSGLRAYDMALRLQYAGIDTKNIKVQPKIKQALNMAFAGVKNDETLVILPTYTALLSMQRIFKEFNQEG